MAKLIPAGAPDAVDLAAEVLQSGGTLVLPTDTVYGLAALPAQAPAIERVFELKQRPPGLHLAVLVAEPGQVGLLSADRRAQVGALMHEFWPGPLTLVLPRATDLVASLGEVDGTVGVRCPHHDLVRAIAARVGPIAATSANIHGRPTPALAVDVAKEFGEVDLVIDGGVCEGGMASTVVDVTGAEPAVLREGPLSERAIVAAWSRRSSVAGGRGGGERLPLPVSDEAVHVCVDDGGQPA